MRGWTCGSTTAWVSVDVTHARFASSRYCRLAVARDYEAAAPVRGSRVGGKEEHLSVHVSVRRTTRSIDAFDARTAGANLPVSSKLKRGGGLWMVCIAKHQVSLVRGGGTAAARALQWCLLYFPEQNDMTYCVAMCVDEGLVFLSDTRTNAGVDHVSAARKMAVFEQPGERVLVLLAAGNLALTQAVMHLLAEPADPSKPTLYNAPTMADAARMVGDAVR